MFRFTFTSFLVFHPLFPPHIYSEIIRVPKANITRISTERSYGGVLNRPVRTLPRDRDYPTGFLSGGNSWKHGIDAGR